MYSLPPHRLLILTEKECFYVNTLPTYCLFSDIRIQELMQPAHLFRTAIAFTALILPVGLNAQMAIPDAPRVVKYQFMVFGVISMYQNDLRVSSNTASGPGIGANFRAEIKIIKGVKFVPGLQILTQSLNFNSYYFAKGYSVKYDGNLNYNHAINSTEIGLPLLLKVNAHKKEDVFHNNMYLLLGWEPKFTLFAHSTVSKVDDGSLVTDNNITLNYENHFLGLPQIGNNIDFGFGINHNFLPGRKSIIFEFIYRYGLSRYVYEIGSGHDILFSNSNINVAIGYRF